MTGEAMSRRAFVRLLAASPLAGGCLPRSGSPADRYVGAWENAEDLLLVERNGLGRGRVTRGRYARPFSWEHRIDRITITFDGSKRPETLTGRIDDDGALELSSPRGTVRLLRVTTPTLAFPNFPGDGSPAE